MGWDVAGGSVPPQIVAPPSTSPKPRTAAYLSVTRYYCPQYALMCGTSSCMWRVQEFAYDTATEVCTSGMSGFKSYPLSQLPATCVERVGCVGCEPFDTSVSFQEATTEQPALERLDFPLAARDPLPAAGDDLGEKGFEFPLSSPRNKLIKQSSTEQWGRYIVRSGRGGPWLRLFVARLNLTNGRADRVPLGYEFAETPGIAETAVVESIDRVPNLAGGDVGHFYAVKIRGVDSPYFVRTATELLP